MSETLLAVERLTTGEIKLFARDGLPVVFPPFIEVLVRTQYIAD